MLRYNDQDIIDGLDKGAINPALYSHYAASFRKAVDTTFAKDSDSGLSDRLRANVSRFAAYKTAHVQRSLQDIMADDSIEDKSAAARATLRAFDRFQDAEYNTAVARARTAKQFETFMDPDNVRLFPNLRWLASRSANPRAAHQAFYDRVWRKDDPFWSNHAPGTEWNCKCDVEETDDPVTENTDFEMPKAPRGLEGNPAQTGEVFTDNASYISHPKASEDDCRKSMRTYMREIEDNYDYTADTPIGQVKVNKICIHETAKSSIDNEGYWLKNEVAFHLDRYLSSSTYDGLPEAVDLSHNSRKSKAKRFKKKVAHFHKLEFDVETYHIIVKVAEMKVGGYIAYSVHL